MQARWEHFPHEADVGVRGYGGSVAEAFEQAGIAMTAAIADPDTIVPRERIVLECQAPDPEVLLTAWLNEIVYAMATKRMLFNRYSVRIDGQRLHGEAWGEHIDIERHRPAVEVKGATFTALRVAREDEGWVAQTVVDV